MGFSTLADFNNKYSTLGRYWRSDFNKLTGTGTYAAGRWYDLTGFAGIPTQTIYGDMCTNGTCSCLASQVTVNGWTLGTGWAPGANIITKTAGSASNLTQTSLTLTNGVVYLITYTLTWTAGTFTATANGTGGTARGASGTFQEKITAGASGGFYIAANATAAGSVSLVSVVPALQSSALTDTQPGGALWHGGAVSAATKHLVNAGISATAGSSVLTGTYLLCDMLMSYGGIDQNSASAQALTTTVTLPRYTDGKGVRAFLVSQTLSTGANAHNIYASYTNAAASPVSGRCLPPTVAATTAAMPGFIYYSGTSVANVPGPFLPLAPGDFGVKSVDNVTFSAAGGTANVYVNIVLCKPLCYIPYGTLGMAAERDFLMQMTIMPRIQDGACLSILYQPSGTTLQAYNVYPYLEVGWG